MLMLSPVRAIFTDRDRYVRVHVSNATQEAIRYRISLVTLEKLPDGQMREVTRESQRSQMIKDMIRFSPRRATINPGQRQVVKLMVRKPATLPPGEYKTYLQVRPLAEGQNEGEREKGAADHGSFVHLDILVSANIPVVIQHGITAQVTPSACKVIRNDRNQTLAEVSLLRQGAASGFGNVRLVYLAEKDGVSGREIGIARGVALYQPEKLHKIQVLLENITSAELRQGALRVEYEPDHSGGIARRMRKAGSVVRDFSL